MSSRTVVTAIVTSVMFAVELGVPIVVYLVVHPPAPSTWLAVGVPNALLLLEAWVIVFLVARLVPSSRH